MFILGSRFNSNPQQVEKNRLDIEELKQQIACNKIYNASIEIEESANTVDSSYIIDYDNKDKGFILDNIGNLFKIVERVDTTIYIYYVATCLKGEQGDQGEPGDPGEDGVGIDTITSGDPTISGSTTTTPINITLTNGDTETVNVTAQNGSGTLYRHIVRIQAFPGANNTNVNLWVNIINQSSDPINNFLKFKNAISTNNYNCTGVAYGQTASNTYGQIIPLFIYNDNNNNRLIVSGVTPENVALARVTQSTNVSITSSSGSYSDTVIQL